MSIILYLIFLRSVLQIQIFVKVLIFYYLYSALKNLYYEKNIIIFLFIVFVSCDAIFLEDIRHLR